MASTAPAWARKAVPAWTVGPPPLTLLLSHLREAVVFCAPHRIRCLRRLLRLWSMLLLHAAPQPAAIVGRRWVRPAGKRRRGRLAGRRQDPGAEAAQHPRLLGLLDRQANGQRPLRRQQAPLEVLPLSSCEGLGRALAGHLTHARLVRRGPRWETQAIVIRIQQAHLPRRRLLRLEGLPPPDLPTKGLPELRLRLPAGGDRGRLC